MKTRIVVLLRVVALMMVMVAMAVAPASAHMAPGSGEHSMTLRGMHRTIHHCIHEHPNQHIHHCIHQHIHQEMS
jgi:hypothetical protein